MCRFLKILHVLIIETHIPLTSYNISSSIMTFHKTLNIFEFAIGGFQNFKLASLHKKIKFSKKKLNKVHYKYFISKIIRCFSLKMMLISK